MSSIERAVAQIDAAESVLVLRPQSAVRSDAECKRLLVGDPATTELLGISLSQPPSGWYDDWVDALGSAPAAAAVITTPDLAGGSASGRDFAVETVATPSNLTGIGVKSTPYLEEWEHPVVTVESLTILLQYATPQNVYRFLHVLTSRIRATGARGQFYLDPSVTDERTVELLKTLFDAVIECDEDDDGWTARLRES